MSPDDDLRWALRLEGISDAEKYADPDDAKLFAATKVLLEAGLQLWETDLAKGECGATHGIGRLTRDRVTRHAKVLSAQSKLSLKRNARSLDGAFDRRWPYIDDYRKDLITYDLYGVRWREMLELSIPRMMELTADVQLGKLKGIDFIREVVRLDAAMRAKFFSKSVAQANLVTDPRYKTLAKRAHVEYVNQHRDDWLDAYRAIVRSFGIVLRPGSPLENAFKGIAWLVHGAAWDANLADSDTVEMVTQQIVTLITGMIDLGDHRSCVEIFNAAVSPTPDQDSPVTR